MLRRFGAPIALLLSLALAACSNSESAGPLTPAWAPNVASPAAAAKKKIKAVIRIHIPKKRRRHGKHEHYISPATQSIAIAITPNGGSPTNYNVDLTPASNPNCVTSLISPTICSVTLNLAPGQYTGTFATYDGLLSGGNPTGNQLSADQNVPFTIAVASANQIDVSLDGIPTSVAFLPDSSSTLSGNTQSGFTLSKCQTNAQYVDVYGRDADSNIILGPGAPAPTLVSDDTTHLTVASPSTSAPNRFAVTRPNATGNVPLPNSTVHLTATATPGIGSGASAVDAVVGVTFNYDICGNVTSYPLANSASGVYAITTGPDNNVWFTEGCIERIGKISTEGTITEYSTGITGTSNSIFGIAPGPDGNLWFTEGYDNKVSKITTSGNVTEYSVGSGRTPWGITAGSDGNMWFAENSFGRIATIATGGTGFTEYSVASGLPAPTGVALGTDGNIWVATGLTSIARTTPDGTVTDFSTGISNDTTNVAKGPDGNVWFTESAHVIGKITPGGTVTEYSPSLSGTPEAIVAGPDGNLWFTESTEKIGKITTDGVVTEYPSGLNYASYGITVGPDGNLWYGALLNSAIARMQ